MTKNKLTKLALALGTVATVAAPIAAVVSCGSDSSHDAEVIIKTTWAAGGAQIKALQEAVTAYNTQKGASDYKVVIQHVEGGYGVAFNNDSKDIKIGHMSSVADAYIDYPDTVGKLQSIAGKDYSLDLSGEGVSLKGFDNRFVSDNAKTLPLALSTEMTTIDLPVLGMFLDAVADDTSKAIEGGIIEKAKNAWKGTSGTEKANITKIWGAANTSVAKVSVTEDTFKDYAKLFAFANVAQNAFANGDGEAGAKGDHHVIGDDSPSNLAYIMYAAEFGATSATKDIFSEKSNLFMKDGAQKTNFLKTLGEIQATVSTGALLLNGGGAYSSGDLTKHRMAFAIGSTAGYSHNYVNVGGDKTTLKVASETKLLGDYDKELELNEDNTVLQTTDHYHNKIVATGTKSYSVVVAGGATALAGLITAAKTTGSEIFQVEELTADMKAAITALAGAKTEAANSYDKNGTAHATNIVVLPSTAVTKISDNGEDTLNKNEAAFIPAPNTNGGKVKYAMSQGPSFVGVKHGGTKDAELGKFLKWFYNPDSRLQGKGTSGSSVVDSFATAASYVTPKTGFTDVKWTASPSNQMVTEVFKDTNVKAYTNPITPTSKSVREQIETTLKEKLQTQYHQGHTMDAQAVYNDIIAQLKADGIK